MEAFSVPLLGGEDGGQRRRGLKECSPHGASSLRPGQAMVASSVRLSPRLSTQVTVTLSPWHRP
jgi:hypothetical protein